MRNKRVFKAFDQIKKLNKNEKKKFCVVENAYFVQKKNQDEETSTAFDYVLMIFIIEKKICQKFDFDAVI